MYRVIFDLIQPHTRKAAIMIGEDGGIMMATQNFDGKDQEVLERNKSEETGVC